MQLAETFMYMNLKVHSSTFLLVLKNKNPSNPFLAINLYMVTMLQVYIQGHT